MVLMGDHVTSTAVNTQGLNICFLLCSWYSKHSSQKSHFHIIQCLDHLITLCLVSIPIRTTGHTKLFSKQTFVHVIFLLFSMKLLILLKESLNTMILFFHLHITSSIRWHYLAMMLKTIVLSDEFYVYYI